MSDLGTFEVRNALELLLSMQPGLVLPGPVIQVSGEHQEAARGGNDLGQTDRKMSRFLLHKMLAPAQLDA